LTYSRSWAADSSNQRVRLKAECDRLEQEVALRREEIRIKDVRMTQIDPQRRPHYPATERMAILELRATRGWSLEQAAKVFLVTADTISSWMRRIDETGSEALVQTCQPVNKFPDCAGYLVQRLKTLCPSLGKQKIAQVLCRAGLHLGTTTVGRILKEDPHPNPVSWFTVWYNQHRPHSTLGGRTPDEVYFRQRPANRSPRFEPRALWPRPAPCALPQVLVKGQPGVRIELEVSYQHSRKHLPIAVIRRAA
jgi:transcriptional regulator with XRE-family HTH domain